MASRREPRRLGGVGRARLRIPCLKRHKFEVSDTEREDFYGSAAEEAATFKPKGLRNSREKSET